ncbi:MAG: Invasion protein expression up-regulator SirB [Methylococcaceae bacterium NSP1-2]|nr:SirB2 family protein [Methylococcaceae bacterium]OYV15781.1 MAG: Invasion protein expression up-regulator SirB [Methylococcaceae bacterium NSP1-2]
MIKIIHLTFVLLAFSSFIGRVLLPLTHPNLLNQKAFKIAPHVIDTLLLLSGITLVFQGSWLSGEYGWLIAKIIALLGYIGLGGVLVMRSEGTTRWLAFAGAIGLFIYIGIVAVTKNPWFFL